MNNLYDSADKKNIVQLNLISNEVGLRFFLMSGSLLGAKLFGECLPGDRDIDLGILDSDLKKFNSIIPRLRSAGFKVNRRFDPVLREEKYMFTIKGEEGRPIDIKVYRFSDTHRFRSLHRSKTFFAKIVWELIDCTVFGQFPELSPFKTRYIAIGKLTTSLINILPFKRQITRLLCNIWIATGGEFGVEVLPAKFFDNFKTIDFLDSKQFVFYDDEVYLNQEYGELWGLPGHISKGGWDKRSHVVLCKAFGRNNLNKMHKFRSNHALLMDEARSSS